MTPPTVKKETHTVGTQENYILCVQIKLARMFQKINACDITCHSAGIMHVTNPEGSKPPVLMSDL